MGDDLESGAQEVGYGKPPKNAQFKKGQSGNPKGRPRGSLNMATVLERTLREKVVVNENGRRRAITKLQAAVTQLANKAAAGDLKALHLLSALVRSAEENSLKGVAPNAVTDEIDERVALGILSRIEAIRMEKTDNATENVTE